MVEWSKAAIQFQFIRLPAPDWRFRRELDTGEGATGETEREREGRLARQVDPVAVAVEVALQEIELPAPRQPHPSSAQVGGTCQRGLRGEVGCAAREHQRQQSESA